MMDGSSSISPPACSILRRKTVPFFAVITTIEELYRLSGHGNPKLRQAAHKMARMMKLKKPKSQPSLPTLTVPMRLPTLITSPTTNPTKVQKLTFTSIITTKSELRPVILCKVELPHQLSLQTSSSQNMARLFRKDATQSDPFQLTLI